MTEKRFECNKGSHIIIDNKTTLHYIMTLDWECSLVTKLLNQLNDENEQLKQNRFICLDCEYSGYTEIGCLCEKQDHWEEFKTECNDFKELQE